MQASAGSSSAARREHLRLPAGIRPTHAGPAMRQCSGMSPERCPKAWEPADVVRQDVLVIGGGRDWRALFEATYAGAPSAVAERVWGEVFGSEYPRGVDPYSFISVRELERIAAEVRVSGDEVLVDLGCGRGGPGLWVAAATHARLIGIDIAANALDAARRRAVAMGFDQSRAEFREASFERTGLSASSVG